MTSSKRRALFGGRFDPIHMGHLEMAFLALDTGLVDEVVFIPTGDPPHKGVDVSYEHRYNMVKLAIRDFPYFSVADYEKDQRYAIYTWQQYSRSGDWYLLGSDSFSTILSWHRYPDIIRQMRFMIVPRMGFSIRKDLLAVVKDYVFTDICYIGVSSTEVRRKIKEGKSIRGLVPERVITYIDRYNLYRR